MGDMSPMTGSGIGYSFIFAMCLLNSHHTPGDNGDTSKQTLTLGAYGPKRTLK